MTEPIRDEWCQACGLYHVPGPCGASKLAEAEADAAALYYAFTLGPGQQYHGVIKSATRIDPKHLDCTQCEALAAHEARVKP